MVDRRFRELGMRGLTPTEPMKIKQLGYAMNTEIASSQFLLLQLATEVGTRCENHRHSRCRALLVFKFLFQILLSTVVHVFLSILTCKFLHVLCLRISFAKIVDLVNKSLRLTILFYYHDLILLALEDDFWKSKILWLKTPSTGYSYSKDYILSILMQIQYGNAVLSMQESSD